MFELSCAFDGVQKSHSDAFKKPPASYFFLNLGKKIPGSRISHSNRRLRHRSGKRWSFLKVGERIRSVGPYKLKLRHTASSKGAKAPLAEHEMMRGCGFPIPVR